MVPQWVVAHRTTPILPHIGLRRRTHATDRTAKAGQRRTNPATSRHPNYRSCMSRPTALSTEQTTRAATPKVADLEIKDAQLIFEAVWQELEADFGRENL